MEDQLFVMRAHRHQLEIQTRAVSNSEYTLERYHEYKNLLARRCIMADEIYRLQEKFNEHKKALNASLLADYKKRIDEEEKEERKQDRKMEREEHKGDGMRKKLTGLFHRK